MKTYRITESQPATAIWTYYVEAESEEEALDKMYRGEVTDTDYLIETNPDDETIIEDIEEVDSLGK